MLRWTSSANGALFVNPLNDLEIRSAIQLIITNEELRISLIKKGLSNVERFKASVIANQYLEYYKVFN